MTHFAVQAVVSPGGIWDPQTHGFWTRFRLSEETRVLLRLHFNMLLHDAIAISIRAPDPAMLVIQFLLQEDVQLVGVRCAETMQTALLQGSHIAFLQGLAVLFVDTVSDGPSHAFLSDVLFMLQQFCSRWRSPVYVWLAASATLPIKAI